MRARLLVLLLPAFFSASRPTSQTTWRLGLRGVGPIRYGMSLSEAARALGEKLNVAPTEPGSGCDYVHAPAAPEGLDFMVIDSVIERADVFRGDATTLSGAHIGSTEDEVKALYRGRIEVQEHPYTGPEGHYLVYVPRDPADSAFRMIFETDGHKVTAYRAGRRPAVQLIEGCT